MPDYSLAVNITGDSASFQNAAKQAKEFLAQFNNELQENQRQSGKTGTSWEQLGQKLDKMGGKMKSAGTKMSIGLTAPLTLAGKEAFTAASDYEENLNKVDVAFGKNADSVEKWADTAITNFGLSKNQALEATALFGDMATSMGISQEEAVDMSVSLAGLAGDMASFKNVGIDQAMTALNGVFTGETESLKQLGIVMTETNLQEFADGLGLVYSEMSQAEKVQLRYNYVMEMSKNAQGDYARTADGTANSVRTFQGTLDNLAIVLGRVLLPILTPIVRGLTEFANWLAEADPWVQQLIVGIGALVAAGGPLLILIGSMASGLSSIINLCTTLKPLMSGLGGMMSGVLNPKMMLIVAAIGAIIAIGVLLYQHWDEICAWAQEKWTQIQGYFQAFDDWLTNVFAHDWTENFGVFGNILNAFAKTAGDIWNNIKSIFSGIIDFVKNVFTGNWSGAWDNIVSIFGNIFGGLVNIAKAPINGVIGIVNAAIDGLNSISVDVPDWIPFVGGQHWGLNLGHIPYLLHGTDDWQGGFARINEGGRGELTYLPDGTQVIPHDISVVYAKEAARLNTSADDLDLSGLLDGMVIQIDNSVRVGDRTIRDDIADYTIRKMGNTYRATLAARGGGVR